MWWNSRLASIVVMYVNKRERRKKIAVAVAATTTTICSLNIAAQLLSPVWSSSSLLCLNIELYLLSSNLLMVPKIVGMNGFTLLNQSNEFSLLFFHLSPSPSFILLLLLHLLSTLLEPIRSKMLLKKSATRFRFQCCLFSNVLIKLLIPNKTLIIRTTAYLFHD